MNGDEQFNALHGKYSKMVRAICRRCIGVSSYTDECCQEVWLAVWQALLRGDAIKNEKPWLQTVVRNTSFSFRERHLGKDRKNISLSQERFDCDGNPTRLDVSEDDGSAQTVQIGLDRIAEAMRRLPPRFAEVLEVMYFSGRVMTSSEVADQLGLKPECVRQRKMVALNAIRKELACS